jgi:hypothetical protein
MDEGGKYLVFVAEYDWQAPGKARLTERYFNRDIIVA